MAESSTNPMPAIETATDLRDEIGSINTRRRRRTARTRRRPRTRQLTPPPTITALPLDPLWSAEYSDTIPDLNFPACHDDQPMSGMRFLLQKQLRNSDVTPIGRIVLPKKEAEVHLPVLTAKEGFSLTMYDMLTSQAWTFKYRYWPNNNSRMYILENVGMFVKAHSLQVGDFIHVYKDDVKDRYMIRAKKKATTSQVVPVAPTEDGIFDSIVPDIPVVSASYSDLYLPLDDGMNMGGYGLNYAFSADIPMHFPSENVPDSSANAEMCTPDSLANAEVYNSNSSAFLNASPAAEIFPTLGSSVLQDFP